MTGVLAQLEPISGAEGYPARHDVRDAWLVRGGERIPVVVKRIGRDFRQPDGNTRAERADRIARHLLACGIDTPEPLGLEVTPEESVFVVRKLEGAVQIRSFFLRRDDPGRLGLGFLDRFLVNALDQMLQLFRHGGSFLFSVERHGRLTEKTGIQCIPGPGGDQAFPAAPRATLLHG